MPQRSFSIPTNRSMKHDVDVWELAIAVALAKGITPRAAIEGTFRCFAEQWMGGAVVQPLPTVQPAPSMPFDATESLGSLFD